MRVLDLKVLPLQRMEYEACWQAMREFTNTRTQDQADELWLIEHPPVFTQGQAGKPEHLISSSDIPLVQSDRGGQVTYHGPGQLVAYPLLNLKRLKLGVRELVTRIENSVVDLLAQYHIESAPKADAPGVYVEGRKIASLGLRVRKGCSYHGVAINVNADLSPFQAINPCGYPGLEMVNIWEVSEARPTIEEVSERYTECLKKQLASDV